MTPAANKGGPMSTRIRDAWKVLRGRAKAVPVHASWFTVTYKFGPLEGNGSVFAMVAPDDRAAG